MSAMEIGYHPSWLRMTDTGLCAKVLRTYAVLREHSRHDAATQRIRVRMIEGASRDKVGEGRVWRKK